MTTFVNTTEDQRNAIKALIPTTTTSEMTVYEILVAWATVESMAHDLYTTTLCDLAHDLYWEIFNAMHKDTTKARNYKTSTISDELPF